MTVDQAAQVQTKKVEVTLTATTCVQYTELVEVPADITPDELNQVVNRLYDRVGADEFHTVGDTWERGDCGGSDSDSSEPATLTAVRTAGQIVLANS